ncbi:MAG: diguanylate cyclase, partial [Candidatus Omnitrophota bacterium]
KQFTVVMIDIDDFKAINDEYGHLAGNDVLIAFARVIKSSVRSIDTVGRYGGEEFMIILPESDPDHALVVLERIRSNLKQTRISSPHLENAKDFLLQFSAGIAVFPYNAKDLKELIWVTDSALRQAKQEGKNRTVVERRKFIRLDPLPGTRIEIVDTFGKETGKDLKIDNISKEGMLFHSTQDIRDKDFLCRIHCPKNKSPFNLTCKVKYKGKIEGELYRIGAYFQDMSENMKERLLSCIEPPRESN